MNEQRRAGLRQSVVKLILVLSLLLLAQGPAHAIEAESTWPQGMNPAWWSQVQGSIAGLAAGPVDDSASGISYDGWLGVDAAQASGGSYRAATEAGRKLRFLSPNWLVGGLSTSPNWIVENQGGLFGSSVGTAGDVNGDGFADVIVGAFWYDNGQTDEGAAFVFHGSANGLSATPNWVVESNQVGAWFGISVGTAGDVNGDGFADVIVGAPDYSNGQEVEGVAFVYHGSAAGLSQTANWTGEGNQFNADFGDSVGTAGDVNGDGFADVIVGAPAYDKDQNAEGVAVIFHGSAGGLSVTPNWMAEGNETYSGFGKGVNTAGDVNGDGYADIMVGNDWELFVYLGSAGGVSLTADWTTTESYSQDFGTAGDVNGDGFDEIMMSNPWYDNGLFDQGRVSVFNGSANGLSTSPDWTVNGGRALAYLGHLMGTAGDVDGDGFDEVIVTADVFDYDSGQILEGLAYVYQGSASGLNTTANWTLETNQLYTDFSAVGTAGDVNRDSYADVITGMDAYGSAHVYHGAPSSTALTLNTYRGPDQGMAEITIDGQSQGVLDLYAPTPQYQYPVSVAGLPPGEHLVTIKVLGQGNLASSGTEVRVDAFTSLAGDSVIQEDHLRIHLGHWVGTHVAEAYDGTVHAAKRAGIASFTFEGPRFIWITARGPNMGQAEVWVDGVLMKTVDLYHSSVEWLHPVVIDGLADTVHEVEIRVLGTHHPAATDSKVIFDAYWVR